jgi:hypothetical protein
MAAYSTGTLASQHPYEKIAGSMLSRVDSLVAVLVDEGPEDVVVVSTMKWGSGSFVPEPPEIEAAGSATNIYFSVHPKIPPALVVEEGNSMLQCSLVVALLFAECLDFAARLDSGVVVVVAARLDSGPAAFVISSVVSFALSK